jgi:hypothetical protein
MIKKYNIYDLQEDIDKVQDKIPRLPFGDMEISVDGTLSIEKNTILTCEEATRLIRALRDFYLPDDND